MADADEWVSPAVRARALRANDARRQSRRKRLVDPTTCDRDYTAAEFEFMRAMEEYKRRAGRPFPTWSEALGVLRSLGYEKAVPDATDQRAVDSTHQPISEACAVS